MSTPIRRGLFWPLMSDLFNTQETIFFKTLRETCNITRSADAAGLTSGTVYYRKKNDPWFAERFEEALQEGLDLLEDEVRRRAFEGVDEPVFYKGVECGSVRKYSDGLAQFFLAAHRPGKYAKRSDVSVFANQGVIVMTGVPGSDDDNSDLL